MEKERIIRRTNTVLNSLYIRLLAATQAATEQARQESARITAQTEVAYLEHAIAQEQAYLATIA